jgi:ribonuclease HII
VIKFESTLLKKGIKYIAGIDEVGRGPLAGPLVVAAVILDLNKAITQYNNGKLFKTPKLDDFYSHINDSKKISDSKRRAIDVLIRSESISYSIIEISNKKLDEIGISDATQLAFYNSIKNLDIKPEHILTDSFEIKKITLVNQTNINRGDQLSISIAAASIIAKVYRDNKMIKYHNNNEIYAKYSFDKHKGYGTKAHIEALKKYGYCDIHRKSFEPIRSMYNYKI